MSLKSKHIISAITFTVFLFLAAGSGDSGPANTSDACDCAAIINVSTAQGRTGSSNSQYTTCKNKYNNWSTANKYCAENSGN